MKKKIHENSLKNLKPIPWKPGQSGNPKGGPKGKMLTTLLRQKLEGKDELIVRDVVLLDDKNQPTKKKVNVLVQMTTKERVVIALLNKARKGDILALREVFNRIDGMPGQEISGDFNLNAEVNSLGLDWSKVPTSLLLELKKYMDK